MHKLLAHSQIKGRMATNHDWLLVGTCKYI